MNRDAWQLKMKKIIHEKMHHIGENIVAIHKSQRKKIYQNSKHRDSNY